MKTIYETAFGGWKTDTARFWTLFSLMSVVNGALLASLSFGGADAKDEFADWRVGVALLGLVLCFLWYGIQKRMASWCAWWEQKLETIEPLYRRDAQIDLVEAKIFEGRKGLAGHAGISTRVAGGITPLLFGVGWLFVANRELQFMTPEVLKAAAGLVIVLTSPLCLFLGSKILVAARKSEDGWRKYIPGYALCFVGVLLVLWFAGSTLSRVFP